MQKTFWWNWTNLAALAVVAVTAGMAQAEETVPHCFGIRSTDIQPAAQESWPIVTRNAFTADGTAPRFLSLTLLIPVVHGDQPPCLAAYLVDSLTRDGDGVIHGRIVPTSMDTPVYFYEPVTVDPALIADWRYAEAADGLIYGDFHTRALFAGDPAARARAGLAEAALPPAWRK